ncbi:hypothetical protein BDD43_1143 [Mucilaginibacter gracilis]|uniref:Uncharacterized protein n=2 Tax=Mucilaginibacter TaxID=423349 RepID=H1YH24_9SPHI|nr:hypothetical protein Mucpa_3333 [Mucilaginibacter paludis DSM 18603]RKR81001.1 hypothetical protein BDD43_1143 [Mucilaginibacter gracilis]
MKYFVLLLCVYMTILALMPCRDKEDKEPHSSITNLTKAKTCGSHANQESCPPFCTCNCCSSARYLRSNPLIVVFAEVSITDYPDYVIPAIQNQPIKIWQPPQIS